MRQASLEKGRASGHVEGASSGSFGDGSRQPTDGRDRGLCKCAKASGREAYVVETEIFVHDVHASWASKVGLAWTWVVRMQTWALGTQACLQKKMKIK